MRISPLITLAAAFLFCAGARGEDYTIKLQRPAKVGEKFHVEGTGGVKQALTISADGKVVKNQAMDFTAQYDVEETTLAIDDRSRTTKLSIKVGKLTKTEDGHTTEIVAKDTVINVSKPDKKTLFEIDGHPVEPAVAAVLNIFISIGGNSPTDDDIFGTKEPKKVGDTWPANAKLMEEDMRANGGGNAENLAGTTKLESVAKGASGDVEKISAHVAGKFMPPLPPKVTVDETAMELGFEGEFPVKLDEPRLTESSRMTLTFSAHGDGPNGQKATFKGSMQQFRATKMTLVK